MAVKTILVPVRDDGRGESNLAHAAAVARSHNAHIDVLHCRPSPTDMVPYGVAVPLALREQIKKYATSLADEDQKALETQFDGLIPDLGLTKVVRHDAAAATVTWHEETGKMADIIQQWGRLSDLIVVSRPDRTQDFGLNTLLSALYHCSRPVMLCPPDSDRPDRVGQRVAIAWNGAMEVSRAVALSLDFLRGASEVVVLDGGSAHSAASGPALKLYLASHGIDSAVDALDAESNPGRAILEAAAGTGADTLLMGAYSHSRGRERVFGGASQYIVDNADLPVVMAH